MFLSNSTLYNRLILYFSNTEINQIFTRIETYKSHWSHPPVKTMITGITILKDSEFSYKSCDSQSMVGALGKTVYNAYCEASFRPYKNPKFTITKIQCFSILGDCLTGRLLVDIPEGGVVEECALFSKEVKQVVLKRYDVITANRNTLVTSFELLLYIPTVDS